MSINGSVKSCESIVVDGTINGDVTCDDTILISRGAFVTGSIIAKEIVVDGIVKGPLEANSVVVNCNAIQTGYIIATDIKILGIVDGDILARESLVIEKSAKVKAYDIKAQIITMSGSVEADVTATEIIEMKCGAVISGDLSTNDLQIDGQSKVLGQVKRYSIDARELANRELSSNNMEEKNSNRVIRRIK